MLKDLLTFIFQYPLRSARGKRAAGLLARAVQLWNEGDLAKAAGLLRQASALEAASARIATSLGMVLWELGKLEEGMQFMRRAVELDPGLPAARTNLAIALYLNGASDESIAQYREALRLDPANPSARLNLLMPLLETCDWHAVEAETNALKARLAENPEDDTVLDSIDPFLSLLVPLPQALRLRIARRHSQQAAKRVAGNPPLRRAHRHTDDRRLRIGYVSNGFRDGATAHLIAGMIEAHDRGRFAVFGYSLGRAADGDFRARMESAFDHFADLQSLSHHAAAQRIADDAPDILIDLMGFQADARPEIAEQRPAPLQMSFLGYPGTLGSAAIDYLVADRLVLPAGDFDSYSEKIVWMPDSYQVNDRARRIAEPPAVRAAHGLPEGFVFCAFNQHSKIERRIFERWTRILASVPGSVLWLQEGPGETRLRSAARQAGIDSARLVFAPRLPKPEHLSRLRLADLFLDTYTYNAHTTSSDALWAGVPVLTCPSDAFAGRVAASLLHAVGLPELNCADLAEYEQRAIDLARDPARLASLREKLAAHRMSCPLFDTERFTRSFESALEKMWSIHCSGARPESFAVQAGG